MIVYSKRLLKFSLIALAIWQLFAGNACALDYGERAPEFSLPSTAGDTVQLSNYKGKLVYLDFWASWCPTCLHSLKWLDGIQQRFSKKGLQVLTVNVDEDANSALQALSKAQAKLVVGFDPNGTTPASYNVQSMPSSYLISAEGKVLAIHRGLSEDDKHEIEKSISRYLGS